MDNRMNKTTKETTPHSVSCEGSQTFSQLSATRHHPSDGTTINKRIHAHVNLTPDLRATGAHVKQSHVWSFSFLGATFMVP
jgi:hypothetical protein